MAWTEASAAPSTPVLGARYLSAAADGARPEGLGFRYGQAYAAPDRR